MIKHIAWKNALLLKAEPLFQYIICVYIYFQWFPGSVITWRNNLLQLCMQILQWNCIYIPFCLPSTLHSPFLSFVSPLYRVTPRHPILRHNFALGALWKAEVPLFKKHYSTERYIRSSKQESGLTKMTHHHVKQLSSGTHSTSWHFTQSKKTHTHLNTGRSIT